MDPKKLIKIIADWANDDPACWNNLPKEGRAEAIIEETRDATQELQKDTLDAGGLLSDLLAELDREDLALLESQLVIE
jgi:hypothetical protein